MPYRVFLHIIFLLAITSTLQAQRTEIFFDKNADFRNAQDLFDKEKFGAAREAFKRIVLRIDDPNDEVRVNSEYYNALCALELFNKDSETLLSDFIRRHPESPRIHSAFFQLGRYHYRRKKFKEALYWLDLVDEYKLENKALAEFYFKKGYSHFKSGHTDKADQYFYQIKEADSDYRHAALYFHAHIAYEKKKYQTALEGFKKLTGHRSFGKVAPFYIAQIYFLQEKYDELIAHASAIIDTGNVKKEAEIARLVGEAHYLQKQYKEAIPYFEKYERKTGLASRTARYQLGFSYYKSGECKASLEHFNRLTDRKDTMAQLAYYHMADCYLQNNKTAARNAFREASKMAFDPYIRENALYNYAKLSYELDNNPFNEAVLAFEEYLETYPNSTHKEEAYGYLLNVYLTTHDHQNALASLDKIPGKDLRQQTAYQMVAFNRGVELFNKKKYTDALAAFNKAHAYKVNREMSNSTFYWKAETWYRMKEYENAIVQYMNFQKAPGAILHPYYNLSNYNIGYAQLKKKQYAGSIPWFRKYTSAYKADDRKRLNDAYLRIGDSYYIGRNYVDALFYYDKAIKIRLINTDYALLQKGKCYGLNGDKNNKINTLKQLINEFDHSRYMVEAKFELAEAYRLNNQTNQAMNHYHQVVREFPASSKVKPALLEIGRIQYQKGRTKDAIQTLKRIALESAALAEADNALKFLKTIYSDIGEINDYVAFAQTLPYMEGLDQSHFDTLSYEAAQVFYFDEKCGEAVAAFTDYLGKYNHAIFEVNARYYRSVCNYKLGEKKKALEDLNYVADLPSNIFTEDALLWASRLNYEFENYPEALAAYAKLEQIAQNSERSFEAQTGLMRCFRKLGNCTSARQYADQVLASEKLKNEHEMEAHLVKAMCYFETNQMAMAYKSFKKIAEGTDREIGAKARYQMALIRHLEKRYDDSDKEVREMIKHEPTYDHWMAMSFLILAENAIETNDLFQAKATLRSVIDHHEGAEVVKKAQERLDEIIAQENQENGERQMENFEVEIEGGDPKDKSLFDEKDRQHSPGKKNDKEKNAGSDNHKPDSPDTPENP